MPWCPQCKTEYREGFTECKDCKIALVDELEEAILFEPFYQAEDKKVAEKLASFFEYSGLPAEVSYDEEYELYIVSIPPETEKDARKLYQAFYMVETERMMNTKASKNDDLNEDSESSSEASSDPDDLENDSDPGYEEDSSEEDDNYADQIPSDDISGLRSNESGIYVMKSDQYKDLTGTVWIFLFFGVAGFIFVLLNIARIFTFLNGWLPNLVMGALFLFFIIVALTTNQRAKKVRSEIDAENLLTRDINNWLKEHVTQDFLASIHNENISEEANYIRYADYIKELLIKEFGTKNLAYLDRLIDEFYNNTFDEEEY